MKLDDINWDYVQDLVDDSLEKFLPGIKSGSHIYEYAKHHYKGDIYKTVKKFLNKLFSIPEFNLITTLSQVNKENCIICTNKDETYLCNAFSLLSIKPYFNITSNKGDVRFKFWAFLVDYQMENKKKQKIIKWLKEEMIIEERHFIHLAFGEIRDLVKDESFQENLKAWLSNSIRVDMEKLQTNVQNILIYARKEIEDSDYAYMFPEDERGKPNEYEASIAIRRISS